MNDYKTKLSQQELVAQLQSKGWDLVTGDSAVPVRGRTLHELACISHGRHKAGQAPGSISSLKDALELDLEDLIGLWQHLGLMM